MQLGLSFFVVVVFFLAEVYLTMDALIIRQRGKYSLAASLLVSSWAFSRYFLVTSTQALTMHADGQRLGGVVRLCHIVSV